jgi:transcriptional regulator NrdR family protein
MKCPYCNQESKVTNSRLQKRANNVWRRRQCLVCHAVWTTLESSQSSTTYKVSSNGVMIDFHPELLLISLYECLKHRKTPELDAQYVYSTVLTNLKSRNQPTFEIQLITIAAYKVLKNYDKLAADIYKATHKINE